MLNIELQKDIIKDKILACWIGKNIGGTMGGPYEGTKEFLDIKGYSSPKGEPLPNDDLDLQIAWLFALERYGVKNFNANVLRETWLNMISPNWNEYGVGKKNLRLGLLPPLSGEYDNDKWKNSNGAWIRSEIWACLAPGFPNIAIKYAIMDASIDHGISEGLYAEIYTAALESIAFFETNTRKIVETALSFIPDTCRVAKCIKLVLEEYDKKTPYKDTRNKLVDLTKDLGWFQAPANLGYVTIGLIYGEGDFKNSMIYAINCGDDTDCTGGTVGAVMGIIGGINGIPADWREYIGDRILQVCINPHYNPLLPKTCEAFTDRIMKIQPVLLKENEVDVTYSDNNSYNQEVAFGVLNGYSKEYLNRSRFSFDISDSHNITATVEYETAPIAHAFKEFNIKINFKHLGISAEILQCEFDLILPEGWTADYRKSMYIVRVCDYYTTKVQNISGEKQNEYSLKIIPGENILPQNHIYMLVNCEIFTSPLVIPITLLG